VVAGGRSRFRTARQRGRNLVAVRRSTESSDPVTGPLSCGLLARREGFEPPNRQIRRLVLCVDLVGSRGIWPAHVGWVVDLVGSRRVPSDRLDDQTDDQGPSDIRSDAKASSPRSAILAAGLDRVHYSHSLLISAQS
jgi:hypothetical protein